MSAPTTDEYLEDQLALSRLDDDGAPPGTQPPGTQPPGTLARTHDQASPGRARLSLIPASEGHGGRG